MSEAWYSAEFIASSAKEDNSIEEEEKNSIEEEEKNSNKYGEGEGETLYSIDEEVTPPSRK